MTTSTPKLVGEWSIGLMQDQLKGKQKDGVREEVRNQLNVEKLSPELLAERKQLGSAYEAPRFSRPIPGPTDKLPLVSVRGAS